MLMFTWLCCSAGQEENSVCVCVSMPVSIFPPAALPHPGQGHSSSWSQGLICQQINDGSTSGRVWQINNMRWLIHHSLPLVCQLSRSENNSYSNLEEAQHRLQREKVLLSGREKVLFSCAEFNKCYTIAMSQHWHMVKTVYKSMISPKHNEYCENPVMQIYMQLWKRNCSYMVLWYNEKLVAL